jgi:hypothetical protein
MGQPTGPTPAAIFRIAQGFMAAKYLFAANELGVFAALPPAGATLAELAAATGVPPRSLRIVLDALVALELLTRDGATYRHTPSTEAFLSRRHPTDVSAFVRFWDRLSYPAWVDFADTVRSARIRLGGAPSSPDDLAIMTAGIGAITALSTHALGAAYDFAPHRRLLDLGGGTGDYVVHLGRRFPALTGTVFELAPDAAARTIADAGMRDRFAVVEGDFFVDPLPDGHDVVLLAATVHMYLPDQLTALFRRIHAGSAPGTRLLLLDFWLDATRTQPLASALMAGEFLVVEGGDAYSVDDAHAWLAASGWRFDEHRALPGAVSLIIATRP